MDRSYIYCTTLLIVFVVQARALQGTASINGDPLIGSNVTVTCNWTLSVNESLIELTVSSPAYTGSNNNFFYQILGTGDYYRGVQYNSRLSLVNDNFASRTVGMVISGLQCSDEKEYFCTFKSGIISGIPATVNVSVKLVVKARPKSPSIRNTPNISSGDIKEKTNINVTCNANLGRPGLGNIQWKIYRNNVPETIIAGDPRILDTKNVSLTPGDDSCTQRMEQTLGMQVNRSDQDLAISCFVQNSDFQDQVPVVCQDLNTDLCAKTGKFRIVYGVDGVVVSQEPTGTIYQGMPVKLTCYADGVPAPDYMWVKVGEENSTLSGAMEDGKYKLALSDRITQKEQGDYNCTATNTVMGQSYSATSGLNLAVLITTTSTSTTTTTTPTTSVSTNKVPAGVTGATGPHTKDDNDDDKTKIIIIVVVVVGSCIIIAIVIGVVCWKRRKAKKGIEEPSEKPYNNRTNLSFQNPQPDLVADKKFQNPNLDYTVSKSSLSGSNPSFSEKHEDGLMYADLTYDNKPRSRKPMAINDAASDYSDIQMPQV